MHKGQAPRVDVIRYLRANQRNCRRQPVLHAFNPWLADSARRGDDTIGKDDLLSKSLSENYHDLQKNKVPPQSAKIQDPDINSKPCRHDMRTSLNGNIFRVTGPLWREFTDHRYRSPVNSPHKGQWRGALMFSLICAWTNGWVNNWYVGDLRRRRAHYDITVMITVWIVCFFWRHHVVFVVSMDNLTRPEIYSGTFYAYVIPITRCVGYLYAGLILGLRPANERRRYFVPTSLIGWVQA